MKCQPLLSVTLLQAALFTVAWSLPAFFGLAHARPDKGMYPPGSVPKEALVKAGLSLNPDLILTFSEQGLLPALVRVGGCSGSFVSREGLIVTNHHCAFDAVAAASTPERNHLENGFYAPELSDEIPAKGLSLRITVGFHDVSKEVLEGLPAHDQPVDRHKAIKERIKALENKARTGDTTLTHEVAEMFPGKSYLLFQYKILRDVRLVYVPSRAIGEFGGESDNWVWPRHTGDYAFVRAYVGPQGQARNFHPENVPYRPLTYLPVASQPLQENDFVMIMGYPGQTFRNYPASFLRYHQEKVLPITLRNFDWLIHRLDSQSSLSVQESLLWSPRIKSLANRTKNYQGKIQGLRRVSLLSDFEKQDSACLALATASERSSLRQLDSLYGLMHRQADLHLNFSHLTSQSKTVQWLMKQAELREKLDALAGSPLEDSMKQAETNALKLWKEQMSPTWRPDLEADILGFFMETYPLLWPDKARVGSEKWLAALRRNGRVPEHKGLHRLIGTHWWGLSKQIKEEQNNWNARINALLPSFIELRLRHNGQEFIPDANSTLRLTYGQIKGYSPEDGVFHRPFTNLEGMFQKAASGHPDYKLDQELAARFGRHNQGIKGQASPSVPTPPEQRFGDLLEMTAVDATAESDQTRVKKPRQNAGDVPVAFLYNLDTTGGNSGSPVVNAYGQLVGVNFDRAFGATINDYAWNADYSRSIGVDIQFVIWNLRHRVRGHRLLQELTP